MVETTETQLRCLALYASTLADALTHARVHHPARLARIRPTSVRGVLATCTASEQLLRKTIVQIDRELALRAQDVADLIRSKASH